MREDESDAARIDADLDARDALQAAAATTAATSSAAEPAADQAEKPWWEDDPRFTSRFDPT
ncbi:MAG TPA: hypothetical protein VFV73_10745 [Streptosporangiaceae bacterium]|nr:hypothetical protein [Streptosporangiaceae bacterium]